MKPKISVIIPTYNEEIVIGECLESLARQTRKDMEVIIVDDGSTDRTLGILSKFRISDFGFRILRQAHKGPGPARNLGAKYAKGEILVFVDADMTFAPDFIKRLVQPIEEGKVKGTFSREEYVAGPENIWSACWGINEGWEKGRRHPKNYPNKQKVFRAILASEFNRVDGFSPTGEYTDDWTLAEKLGYEAVAAPGGIFYHKSPETLQEIFVQAKWIGKRRYKLGSLGKLVALLRASLPVSLVVGLWKSVLYKEPAFLVFKIVYDFGIFMGALFSLLGGSLAK